MVAARQRPDKDPAVTPIADLPTRATALRRIAAEVSGRQDLDGLFRDVIDEAFTLFGVDQAGLWTYDDGPTPLRLVAQRGLSPDILEIVATLPRDARTAGMDALRAREVRVGQPVGPPVRPARPRGPGGRDPGRDSDGPDPARARDHRECRDGPVGGGDPDAQPPPRHGGPARARRLRDRLLVAVVPAPPAARHHQDRPDLRLRARRRGRPVHRRCGHRPGPRAAHQRGRRGHRDRGPVRGAARDGLRRRAGLPVRSTAAGRRRRAAPVAEPVERLDPGRCAGPQEGAGQRPAGRPPGRGPSERRRGASAA